MRGLLVVNKAKGWTSFDVVNYCKHALHTREVGHLGTLDPMATGVLVVTIGSATKLFDMFLNKTKKYIAKFEFGYSTDTLDAEGVVDSAVKCSNLSEIKAKFNISATYSTQPNDSSLSEDIDAGKVEPNNLNSNNNSVLASEQANDKFQANLHAQLLKEDNTLGYVCSHITQSSNDIESSGADSKSCLVDAGEEITQIRLIEGQTPTLQQIIDILPEFIGEIEQMPPKYSAKKIQGRKACDLARAGKEVELKPAKVRIESLKILDYANNILTLEIVCGAGTYIRSLGRDIALKLNSLATMVELIRTQVGKFDLENSVNVKDQGINLQNYILPIDSVFCDLPTLDNVNDVKRLTNGQTIICPFVDGEYRMYLDGQFVGIATAKNNHIKMSKYFKL